MSPGNTVGNSELSLQSCVSANVHLLFRTTMFLLALGPGILFLHLFDDSWLHCVHGPITDCVLITAWIIVGVVIIPVSTVESPLMCLVNTLSSLLLLFGLAAMAFSIILAVALRHIYFPLFLIFALSQSPWDLVLLKEFFQHFASRVACHLVQHLHACGVSVCHSPWFEFSHMQCNHCLVVRVLFQFCLCHSFFK